MLIHLLALATVLVFLAAGAAAFIRHCWLMWTAGAAEPLTEGEATHG